jgi:hypothetical protein
MFSGALSDLKIIVMFFVNVLTTRPHIYLHNFLTVVVSLFQMYHNLAAESICIIHKVICMFHPILDVD